MKILAISDLHLDHMTHGVSRLEDLRDALMGKVLPTARNRGVDLVAFLGDLCDPDDGPALLHSLRVMGEFATEIHRAEIPLLLMAGNHDVVEDGSGITTLSPLRAFENSGASPVFISEHPQTHNLHRFNAIIATLPFVATSHAYDPAKQAREVMASANGKPVVFFSHLHVAGVQPGEETKELPRGREVLFPVEETTSAAIRLQGHYHRQQAFDPGDDGPPILIVGSLQVLGFGEEGNEPGFLIVEVP